jgi:transcriptional regulator with XRE-family HTH domain/quercetin dioxygenase-like cupin family protein
MARRNGGAGAGAEAVALADRGPDAVGARLRAERERQRMSLRELARRLDVSASLISQVELGKATPSVGTLYAMVSELGLSLDELFFEAGAVGAGTAGPAPAPSRSRPGVVDVAELDASHPSTGNPELVVRSGQRNAIQLDSGVRWERLTSVTEQDVDFLYVVYEVGGASCAESSLIRHAGREYGHVVSGRLGVTVGFETHELGPGDSISFDSTTPHRLFNAGKEQAVAIWFVVGRGGDVRVTSGGVHTVA